MKPFRVLLNTHVLKTLASLNTSVLLYSSVFLQAFYYSLSCLHYSCLLLFNLSLFLQNICRILIRLLLMSFHHVFYILQFCILSNYVFLVWSQNLLLLFTFLFPRCWTLVDLLNWYSLSGNFFTQTCAFWHFLITYSYTMVFYFVLKRAIKKFLPSHFLATLTQIHVLKLLFILVSFLLFE